MDVGRREYCQCGHCGSIHSVDLNGCKIIDDLYTILYCPDCHIKTKHLLCGDKEEDIYITYNLNIDPRYYEYRTK